MEQFAPLKRSKDGQPVRYLVVDDSVFARKNLARIDRDLRRPGWPAKPATA